MTIIKTYLMLSLTRTKTKTNYWRNTLSQATSVNGNGYMMILVGNFVQNDDEKCYWTSPRKHYGESKSEAWYNVAGIRTSQGLSTIFKSGM